MTFRDSLCTSCTLKAKAVNKYDLRLNSDRIKTKAFQLVSNSYDDLLFGLSKILLKFANVLNVLFLTLTLCVLTSYALHYSVVH
jgi:hypothetical protein